MVNLGIRTTMWNVQVYSDPENEHPCSWRFPDPREGNHFGKDRSSLVD